MTTKKENFKSKAKKTVKPVAKKTIDIPQKNKKREFIVKSIFMIHVRRIGFLRTAIGGGLMYLSFLEFVFLHLTSIIVLYQWMLTPFFNIKKFNIKDYIILDRGKIEGMMYFDRLNCEFCGYANGTAKLWNDQLDAISVADLGRGRFFKKIISGTYSVFLVIFLFMNFIFSKILFSIIALFLGMHWASNKEAYRKIIKANYAGGHNFLMRKIIRFAKLSAETLAINLEQIESSWCPLKHIETKTSVTPDHHKNFIDRSNIGDVYEVLAKEGTVSKRKPKY